MNKFGAQNMVSHLKKVLMKKPQKFMSKVDLQKWNYTSPLDEINYRYGSSTLRLAAEGIRKDWQMRREKVSPCYTTSFDQLMIVKS